MQCPGCGAAMRLDDDKDFFTCEYCGNVFFPEPNGDGVRVLGEPAAEACPVCAVPLVHAALAGHRLLHCARCRGMLVEVGVFVPLMEELRARCGSPTDIAHRPAPGELDRHIRCPRCHDEMDTHLYGGPGNVVIDNCERCELNWLDYGELRWITQAAEGQYVTE